MAHSLIIISFSNPFLIVNHPYCYSRYFINTHLHNSHPLGLSLGAIGFHEDLKRLRWLLFLIYSYAICGPPPDTMSQACLVMDQLRSSFLWENTVRMITWLKMNRFYFRCWRLLNSFLKDYMFTTPSVRHKKLLLTVKAAYSKDTIFRQWWATSRIKLQLLSGNQNYYCEQNQLLDPVRHRQVVRGHGKQRIGCSAPKNPTLNQLIPLHPPYRDQQSAPVICHSHAPQPG